MRSVVQSSISFTAELHRHVTSLATRNSCSYALYDSHLRDIRQPSTRRSVDLLHKVFVRRSRSGQRVGVGVAREVRVWSSPERSEGHFRGHSHHRGQFSAATHGFTGTEFPAPAADQNRSLRYLSRGACRLSSCRSRIHGRRQCLFLRQKRRQFLRRWGRC